MKKEWEFYRDFVYKHIPSLCLLDNLYRIKLKAQTINFVTFEDSLFLKNNFDRVEYPNYKIE
jgi:hypothetical protein